MLTQVRADAVMTMRDQQRNIAISAVLTGLAAILGLTFSLFVSSGITRPVRRLLDGTRAVEAGRLDGSIDVTTHDEIGELTTAFNAMVEQLRETRRCGKPSAGMSIPRVVETLVDRPALAASDGQRRVMTVLFCDMKGFTSLSEAMTPQGLVKVMNHFLSAMSEQIRNHHGVIDKYIGDAIMAYWGPPFTENGEDARLACLAAVGMLGRIAALRTRIARIARRARGRVRMRRSHRHRDRRGIGRQYRLRIHDELHGDGRYGKSGVAPGGREQGIWQPLPDFRSGDGRRRRCDRDA